MPRWAWFLPLGVIAVAGGLIAFRYGWLAANMTESAAIEAYAARYMQETGANAADCAARPGQSVWLVIRCGEGESGRVYRVNRFGGLVGAAPAGETTGEPRT